MDKEKTQIFHSGKFSPDTRSVRVVIEVVAGIVPNTPLPEYTRRFIITSEDWYSKDEEAKQRMLQTYGYAQEYMRNLWNPSILNWVRCDWIYF